MRLLAAPSRLRIAGCAVAVLLSLPPYSPVLVALLDGFPKSWCALQHPTFSRSPSFRSLQVCACRFSPVLDRCGHAYGVSSLSGLLVPWVGCLVLVSLEPVCACLQHPSRTGFPLPLVVAGVRCVAAPSVKLASFHGWLPGFGFFSRCALAGSTR